MRTSNTIHNTNGTNNKKTNDNIKMNNDDNNLC